MDIRKQSLKVCQAIASKLAEKYDCKNIMCDANINTFLEKFAQITNNQKGLYKYQLENI